MEVILKDGNQVEVKIEDVQIGDLIVAKPGDKIAVDGIIVSGESFIDESSLTGEPIPVEKGIDAIVFSGTLNQNSPIQYKALKVGNDTLLAQIIQSVKNAQGSKAPVQQLVDKIAGVFVPIVIIIAILTFITWLVLGQENAFTMALLSMITVLVIACPCALGLATPTAIMVGMGKGAEQGILIKNAESLELAKKVDAIILTGGISYDKYVVGNLKESLSFIAPIVVMAGEFEMEALVAGAIRVLSGQEKALEYTGKPVWTGFIFSK